MELALYLFWVMTFFVVLRKNVSSAESVRVEGRRDKERPHGEAIFDLDL